MPAQEVGMIGLGIMGTAAGSILLEDGFARFGFDVPRERVRALEASDRHGDRSTPR